MAAPNTKQAWKLQEFTAHGSEVTCVGLGHKTGRVMATGGQDRKVNLWSVGKAQCIMSLSGHTASVEAVRLGKEEEMVVTGSQSGTLKLWDLEHAKILRTLTGHKASIQCLDFHPYGDYTASGSMDCNVKLWDVRRKGCIYTYKGHSGGVRCLHFSPDGRWIASTADDGLVKLWDLTAGKALTDLTLHKGPVTCVEFHPHELLLATAGNDGTVKFWDLETFKLVCSTEDMPSAPVRCIAFHPDGVCLYSGSQDRLKVYGWEPAQCYDTVSVAWGHVADLTITDTQLIGASFHQTNVASYIVDLEKVRPLGGAAAGDAESQPSQAPRLSSSRKSFTTEKPSSEPMKKEEAEEKSEEGEEASGAHIHHPEEYQQLFHHPAQQASAMPRKMEKFQPPADEGTPAGVKGAGDAHHPPPPAAAAGAVRAEDFLPAAAPAGSRSTEAELEEQFGKGHNPMMAVLIARNYNLQIVRAMWTSGNTKTAIDTAISMKDPAVLVDLLSVLNLKTSLWTLDLCTSLLPQLHQLLLSKYDSYVEAAGKAVKVVVRYLGPTIKSNLSPAPGHGIDLAREDRQRKCRQCYRMLTDIRAMVERRQEDSPGLAILFKEMLILLSTLG